MATSAGSKIYAAQLAALINYYNRIATDITKVQIVLFSQSIGINGVLESKLQVLLKKSNKITKLKLKKNMI